MTTALLIEIAAKSVAVALIALVTLRGMRGASAAVRHRAACAAFAVLAALPALCLLPRPAPLPRWSVNVSAAVPTPAVPRATQPEVPTPTPPAAAPILRKPVPAPGADAPRPLPWGAVFGAAWVLLSAAALLRLLAGLWAARRLVRDSVPASDALKQSAPEGAAVRLSARTATPLACGLRRPVILLPADAPTWDAERLRAALLHEAAHVARGDFLAQTLAHLVCVAYAGNPLVWRLLARLRAEAEAACDARVIAAGMAPSAYAAHLLAIARQTPGRPPMLPLPAMVSPRGNAPEPLEGRIQMFLADPARPRLSRRRALFLATATVLTLTPTLAVRLAAGAGGDSPAVPPQANGPTDDAKAFLRWSMDRYASVKTFRANATWTLQIGERPDSDSRKDRRTVLYAAPNRFRVTHTAYRTLKHFYTSDGKSMVVRTEGYDQAPETYPAPKSFADADAQNMSHPHFGGSALYRFFGGGARLDHLLDAGLLARVSRPHSSKDSAHVREWAARVREQLSGPAPHFGPDVVVNGEPCKTVIFNGGLYAHERRAVISVRDGFVRRLEYYEPGRKLSPTELADMKGGVPENGMLSPAVTIEEYTDIETNFPVQPGAFDTGGTTKIW